MTLYGPNDSDMDLFRVQQGRQKERWYVDPLPACSLGKPFTTPVPSVSTVKTAWPKHLTKWVANETARAAVEQVGVWGKMMPAEAMAFISGASDNSRDDSAARGTNVHKIMESLGQGQQPMMALMLNAADYLPTCEAILADLQPTWIASECIAIYTNEQYCFGGTLDAIWQIEGRTFLVDFKSRKPGKHGAYDEEGAQIAAYAHADYLIAKDDAGGFRRVPVPTIHGGLILSITPE